MFIATCVHISVFLIPVFSGACAVIPIRIQQLCPLVEPKQWSLMARVFSWQFCLIWKHSQWAIPAMEHILNLFRAEEQVFTPTQLLCKISSVTLWSMSYIPAEAGSQFSSPAQMWSKSSDPS